MAHRAPMYPDSAKYDLPLHYFRLDNGLQCYLLLDEKRPLVISKLEFPSGAAQDPPSRRGLAHITEHLFYAGLTTQESEYMNWLDHRMGSTTNAATSYDYSYYSHQGTSNLLETFLWNNSCRVMSGGSGISQADLVREQGVVTNELQDELDQTYTRLDQELDAIYYPPSHPYHGTILGSKDHVNNISLQDVQGFIRRHYGPRNAILYITGDVPFARTEAQIHKYLGSWSQVDEPPAPPQTIPRVTTSTIDLRSPTERSFLQVFWPLPEGFYGRFQETYDFRALLSTLEDRNQPYLHQSLVASGLAVGLDIRTTSRLLHSRVELTITLADDSKADEAWTLVRNTLADIATNGVPAETIQNLLRWRERLLQYQFANPHKFLSALQQTVRAVGDASCFNQYIHAKRNLTKAGLQRCAERLLKTTPCIAHIRGS